MAKERLINKQQTCKEIILSPQVCCRYRAPNLSVWLWRRNAASKIALISSFVFDGYDIRYVQFVIAIF
jgi:hypothetical protein